MRFSRTPGVMLKTQFQSSSMQSGSIKTIFERNRIFVRNMYIFYAYAERTMAWLGASAEDSDLALDIITRIGRDRTSTARTEGLAVLRSILDDTLLEETKSHWNTLSNLFGRPYWTRVWVVQEIAYSYDAIVKCAEREFPMEWFYQTCVVLSDSPSFKDTARVLGTKTHIQLRGMRPVMLMVALRNRINEGKSRPLGSVLSMMRESKTTDPRDKIFGYVTLAHKPPKVDVRYDAFCGEVYAAVARSLIEHDNSLKILSSCDNHEYEGDPPQHLSSIDSFERHHIPDLPSWAPNWADVRIAPPFSGGYEEMGLEVELLNQISEPPEPYQASGNATAEFSFLNDGVSLIVKELVLDGIVDVGADFYGKHIREYFRDVVRVCARCPNAGARYRVDPVDVLLMTVTGNRKGAGAKLGAEDVSAARNDLEDPTFQESLRISSAGRLFFITSAGYMAIGPRGLRINDRVCLIKGCYVPMVL